MSASGWQLWTCIGGSAAGLDEVLDLEAVASGILDPPDEGESLPGAILDGVRVFVGAHVPSL